jgi:nitrite reductase/ring-hydroxylating ferredoxin subunit
MPTLEIPIDALPIDTPCPWEKEGLKIVVVRTGNGVHAFHDMCPHALWPLSAGTFHNGILECPGHGWEFHVQTGRCNDSPTYCLTPVSATLVGEIVRLEWESEATFEGTPQPQGLTPHKHQGGVHPKSAQAASPLHD